MNIFVGNLAFTSTGEDVRQLFAAYGTVDTVNLITDRDTGHARGFGFVEMLNSREAQSALQGLQGYEIGGRAVNVQRSETACGPSVSPRDGHGRTRHEARSGHPERVG